MKTIKLALSYLRYYKSQTLALWLGMALAAALLCGMGSLFYSGQMGNAENSRKIYGDWHYAYMPAQGEDVSELASGETGNGYALESCGLAVGKDLTEEPYPLLYQYMDEEARAMAHRTILEGRYPETPNEAALDAYTLGNLGLSDEIGEEIVIGGKSFTLTGIVENEWAANVGDMEVFVSRDYPGPYEEERLYVKFREDQKLYRQMEAFLDAHGFSDGRIEENDGLVTALFGEEPAPILETVKFAFTDPEGNFTYLILKLDSDYNLSFYALIVLLGLFGAFVIYSIFNISMTRRTAQYALLNTLGIGEGTIQREACAELGLLFLTAYPAGFLLGNGLLGLFYEKLDTVFLDRSAGSVQSGVHVSASEQLLTQAQTAAGAFQISYGAAKLGAVLIFAALFLAAYLSVRSMRKRTIRELMRQETKGGGKDRKIYSRKRRYMPGVLVRKFMLSRKWRFAATVLSLSLGGSVFLSAEYLTENMKIHAELSLKSDDGLGSAYKVSMNSDRVEERIPAAIAEQLAQNAHLDSVLPVKYTLGEITVKKEELTWESYFDEMNRYAFLVQNYGGVCTDGGDGNLKIRYNVYGYEPEMLDELSDFVLEGEIDPERMERENQIVVLANMDGQGNYDFYGRHAGDTVTVRVPRTDVSQEGLLRFDAAPENYIEKEYTIAAVVSRSMAKTEHFLNTGAYDDSVSLYLTNAQMQEDFGIEDYTIVSISPAEGTDSKAAAEEIRRTVEEVPGAAVQDYTSAIESQKQYLRQQQLFCTGVAAVLLVISLFHIMNSMNYTILARRREFGILRAMGITDIGFYRMLVLEGLRYGVCANLTMLALYALVLKGVLNYYMQHVVQFLHIQAEVPAALFAAVVCINFAIACLAVLLPGRRIAGGEIIGEIRRG